MNLPYGGFYAMNITTLLLSFIIMTLSSSALADAIRPLDVALFKLNLVYTQQEQGLVVLDLLAPNMGRWGRLGFNLGNADYSARDSNNVRQTLKRNQYALVWRTEENVLGLKGHDANRALGLATNLRLGQTIYEELDELKKTRSQFTFFEMDVVFQIVSGRRSPDSWVKSSSMGIGSGFRVNYIQGQEFIGTAEVNDLRIFPTFQLALSL
jgi:hypothetical protein